MRQNRLKYGLWTAVICVLLCTSCRPEEVLPSDKMEDLLVELHRVEGILQAADYQYGHNVEVKKYYQVVLAEYGVTQQQFDTSLVWYTDHPQVFNKIYPRVLEREQAALDAYRAEYEQNRASQLSPTEEKMQKNAEKLLKDLHKSKKCSNFARFFWESPEI